MTSKWLLSGPLPDISKRSEFPQCFFSPGNQVTNHRKAIKTKQKKQFFHSGKTHKFSNEKRCSRRLSQQRDLKETRLFKIKKDGYQLNFIFQKDSFRFLLLLFDFNWNGLLTVKRYTALDQYTSFQKYLKAS